MRKVDRMDANTVATGIGKPVGMFGGYRRIEKHRRNVRICVEGVLGKVGKIRKDLVEMSGSVCLAVEVALKDVRRILAVNNDLAVV